MTLSQKVFNVEKRFTAVCIAVMGLAVFLDVVHRVASRESGLLNRFLGQDAWVGWLGTALSFGAFLVLSFAALRARGHAAGGATWAFAAGITAGMWAALKAFVWMVPNGLVWSQTLGLVLMLWVGCVGASMAAHEKRHLALDVGSKIWPKAVLPYVLGLGNLATASFCVILTILSVYSVKAHYGDYVDTAGAGGTFVALPIPKWAAFLAVPIGFSLMAARFLAQAVESFRGHVDEDDTLKMLGIKTDGEQ